MEIRGSCYCHRVRFRAVSHTPYPFLRCYCSICRKTAGGGGFAINIMAQADSLKVEGESALSLHQAKLEDEADPGAMIQSPAKRYFCRHCGSALWVADPRWAEWVYPFASTIDTPLPKPPEIVHMMIDFVAPWVEVPSGPGHRHYARYPEESIAEWHRRHGLYRTG